MFAHNKRLQYTVRVEQPNPGLANLMLEQFGGPQGELAAACRYFTQALSEDDPGRKDMLFDIATESIQCRRQLLCAKGYRTFFNDLSIGVRRIGTLSKTRNHPIAFVGVQQILGKLRRFPEANWQHASCQRVQRTGGPDAGADAGRGCCRGRQAAARQVAGFLARQRQPSCAGTLVQ